MRVVHRIVGVALAAAVVAGAPLVAAVPVHAQSFTLSLSGLGQIDQRLGRCPGFASGDGACGQENAALEPGRPVDVPTIERALGAVPSPCPRKVKE